MRRAWKYLTILVVIASIVWLAYKLFMDWQLIISSISNLFNSHPFTLILLFSLTLLGILVDAFRWKCIIGDYHSCNILPHIRTVITSVTYSNFSFLGIGEHVARINTSSNSKSSKTVLADSVIISILNSITIPCIALPFLSLDNNDPLKHVDFEKALFVFLLLLFAIFILSFFKTKWTADIKANRIVPAFLLTVVKSLLFFLQFYILLYYQITDISPYQLWYYTCSYYFIITLIPLSSGISNVAVRTGVISILFSQTVYISIAISAVIIMWLLNVVLVSISYFAYQSLYFCLHKK